MQNPYMIITMIIIIIIIIITIAVKPTIHENSGVSKALLGKF